jgi:hypothetical protein
MEYKISERAKKVTLGTAVLGLIFLIIGFFQQKDFVYAKKVDNHSVELLYNGHANLEAQNQLKEIIISKMHGYKLEFHDSMHSDNHHKEPSNHHEESNSHPEKNEHHGPTFKWLIHLGHANQENESAISENHESGADYLVEMANSGEISFFDHHFRRFWSNLLVNGFFFFGIALGALFYFALHYATESGWGVVLIRIFEGIMSAMPIGIIALLIVFIVGTFGGHHIYAWMDSQLVDPNSSHFDPIIYGKKAYLNIPFFWIRIVAYFTTFILFLRWFKNKSKEEDEQGGTKIHFTMYRRAALFLVFFAVFSSTMSWDFIMSIDAHWFSTLFGWYCFSGIWLSGMIMVMMITLYLRKGGYLPFVNESHIHDGFLNLCLFGIRIFPKR